MPTTQFTTQIDRLDVWQLSIEIRRLGLPFALVGMQVNLAQDLVELITDVDIDPGDLPTVQAAIDAHIPRDYKQVELDAVDQFQAVPGWATVTIPDALAWFDTNVNDLDSAKQAMRRLVRMVLALRNLVMPYLEGS